MQARERVKWGPPQPHPQLKAVRAAKAAKAARENPSLEEHVEDYKICRRL